LQSRSTQYGQYGMLDMHEFLYFIPIKTIHFNVDLQSQGQYLQVNLRSFK